MALKPTAGWLMQELTHFLVDEASQIGAARRAAVELARVLQFGEEQAGKVAIAVNECATNLVKHAGTGEILLRRLRGPTSTGIEVLAIDKGPGVRDFQACLRDGHSTTGTLGGGLGALSRLSERFDIFTQPGQGTVVRVELWPAGTTQPSRAIEYGGLCRPKAGEPVSGDSWRVETCRDEANVLVADGLGHGLSANEASRAAVDTLARHPEADPILLLSECHAQLAKTRGAAVAVSRLHSSAERGSFASVGNIVGRVETPTGSRQLVSYNGIVGHTMRKLQEFAFPWPKGALLVMHSDGLATQWHLQDYPGLAVRHPSIIAAVLYRDYDRGRDDTSVVVVRNQGVLSQGT